MEVLYYDVMIIGYGPIGKATANLLGKKGWNVGIFEKYETPYGLPRAVKYDHEITRILQSIVPTEEINRITLRVPDHYVWVNSERKSLIEFDWSQEGISGWPADTFFNQAELEEVLDKPLHSYDNVDVRLGYEAVYLMERDDHVEIIFRRKNGDVAKAKAAYVIGCDGANSFVRENMEHTETDLGFNNSFIVLDVIPKTEMKFDPMNLQVCDPKRPTTVVSGGPGRRRWEFMLLPGETKDDFQDEATAWELLKEWNVTPENAILERHTVYTFKAKWVNEWRKGRLMLAGDAAHLTPPFLGQGLSSGMRDAINLSWKLDQVLRGVSDESLLDLYTVERKPHMVKLIEGAVYLGKIICITNEEDAQKRDEAFLKGDYPPFPGFPILTDGVLYQPGENDLAGQLSLQSEVECDGKIGLFDDLIGHGWMIISWNRDPKQFVHDHEEFLEKIDAKCVQVTKEKSDSPDHVVDVTGKYEAYFKEHQVEAIVVRPDFNIYAGVSEMKELPTIMESLKSDLKTTVAVGS